MNIDLSGKVAVVCGSTQGIGRASAFELASLGATIVLVARNESALQQTLSELPKHDQKHSYLVANFEEPETLRSQLKTYCASEVAHILVNNTGGPPGGQAIEASLEAYQVAFAAHLLCNQILAQALVPGMKKEKFGRIINIISTSVKSPIPGLGVSNTIRGAVASWSKTLANELGPFGITVNNVLPGATQTKRLHDLLHIRAEKGGHSYEAEVDQWKKSIPMGRFAEPSEIAAAVAFLASPAASYINGINVPVDGGRTVCL